MSQRPPGGDGRRAATSLGLFANERREFFGKQVRKQMSKDNRTARDAETRRMEEYRRLCKKEGIESKRLKEYDDAKAAHHARVDAKIDDDWKMSAAERKKLKFNIKRKADNVKSYLAAGEKSSHQWKMERVQRQKEKRELEKRLTIQDKEREKSVRMEHRQSRGKLYSQKTKTGQPVMSSRVSTLLDKIQQRR